MFNIIINKKILTKESRDEEYVGVGVHEVSFPSSPTITSKTYLHVEQFS